MGIKNAILGADFMSRISVSQSNISATHNSILMSKRVSDYFTYSYTTYIRLATSKSFDVHREYAV